MEQLQQAALTWNLGVVKEPRGFIKLIQLVIAIFAFATTCSHSTHSSFKISCLTEPVVLGYSYPYVLNNIEVDIPLCNGTEKGTTNLYGNYAAPSQFYVFVGVMAFLYSIGGLVLYICFDDKYRKFDQIPIADFIISAVFTLLWLISSSAWADGVSKVKYYTDTSATWLADAFVECGQVGNTCETVDGGDFASLNVSLIFGFLNMCVWGGNLWFLFKETKWFKVTTEHPQQTMPTSPSEVPQKV